MAKQYLISRPVSQVICFFGILQLLFATGLGVSGFVTLGIYKNINCFGIWAGLPMMVPALLSVMILGTRHRLNAVAIFLTNVVVLAVTAYHAYLVYDEIDFWKSYKEQSRMQTRENGILVNGCYNRGDHCVCRDSKLYLEKDYVVQYCDQFQTGEELFWTMFVLSLGGLFFSLYTWILSFVTMFTCLRKEEGDHRQKDVYM